MDAREKCKETRSLAMDGIRAFVEYAKEQGSENSEKYYVNFTNMVNQALFNVCRPPKNFRDKLSTDQLNQLIAAENIIRDLIEQYINENRPYREIFILIKERISAFAQEVEKIAFEEEQP